MIDPDKVVKVHGQTHVGSDWSHRKLVQFGSAGSRFRNCRFDGIDLENASFGAGLRMSEYVNCSFDGAHIRFGPGGRARFVNCSFQNVRLSDWFALTVEVVECRFSGVLRKAVFNGTVPEPERVSLGRRTNEFRDNDFSAMRFVDVGFRTGIDLDRQRLPTGDEYLYLTDAAAAIAHARQEIASSFAPGDRPEALILIETLASELEGGQRQLLLRPNDFVVFPNFIVGGVFDLLRGVSPRSN